MPEECPHDLPGLRVLISTQKSSKLQQVGCHYLHTYVHQHTHTRTHTHLHTHTHTLGSCSQDAPTGWPGLRALVTEQPSSMKSQQQQGATNSSSGRDSSGASSSGRGGSTTELPQRFWVDMPLSGPTGSIATSVGALVSKCGSQTHQCWPPWYVSRTVGALLV